MTLNLLVDTLQHAIMALRRPDDAQRRPMQSRTSAVLSQELSAANYDTGTFFVNPAEAVRQATAAVSNERYIGAERNLRQAIDIYCRAAWMLADTLFSSTQTDLEAR